MAIALIFAAFAGYEFTLNLWLRGLNDNALKSLATCEAPRESAWAPQIQARLQ